jgi:hypothetical protein
MDIAPHRLLTWNADQAVRIVVADRTRTAMNSTLSLRWSMRCSEASEEALDYTNRPGRHLSATINTCASGRR